jgi:hypothetical protein
MTPFTKHLKSHPLRYIQIWKHLCALECDNSNLIVTILFYMTKQLVSMNITLLAIDSSNAKDVYLFIGHLVNSHVSPNESCLSNCHGWVGVQ